MLSLAINAPKEFKKMVDRHRLDRTLAQKGKEADPADELIEMFRMSGVRIIDKRKTNG